MTDAINPRLPSPAIGDNSNLPIEPKRLSDANLEQRKKVAEAWNNVGNNFDAFQKNRLNKNNKQIP